MDSVPHDEQGVAIALGDQRATFVAALRRGDSRGAAECYATDARLLAPSAAHIWGRTDIARFWQAGMDAGVREIELEPDRIGIEAGDVIALEVGRYTLRITSTEGSETVDHGRYALVHRHERDGAWRRVLETLIPDLVSTSPR